MINRIIIVISFIMIMPAALAAQATQSPHAGTASAEIKALTPAEIAAYRAGEGLGFAKAAELNRYPGPRHVLDLAQQLSLRPEQQARVLQVYERMQAEAVKLGQELLQKERDLDQLFAQRAADSASVTRLTSEIGVLQGRLRALHLNAHVEVTALLKAEQIAAYDRLRGYTTLHKHD